MIEIIYHLAENPDILQLLKESKLSLIGAKDLDILAIIEAFREDIQQELLLWD